MNKTEFLKEENADFNSLDKENAIRLVKLFNAESRKYFSLWQEARRENELLRMVILDSDISYDWDKHEEMIQKLKTLERSVV